MVTAHGSETDDEFEDDEDELEAKPSRGRTKSSGAFSASSGKGHFMSIVAKLKKMPPVYWVLGLGGAALAVDYFVEGEQSVASSLYRGIFGHGEGTSHGRGSAHAGPLGRSPASMAPGGMLPSPDGMLPSAGGMESFYYPAYPYRAPYDAYGPLHGYGHRRFAHSFRHGGAMHGHAGALHGRSGHTSHVRGGYDWE